MKVITTTLEGVGSNRKLDATSYINGIEHVENDTDELLKVSGFLKPDRHLLILVPGHNYLHSKFDGTIGHFRRCNKSILQNAVPKDLKKRRKIYRFVWLISIISKQMVSKTKLSSVETS